MSARTKLLIALFALAACKRGEAPDDAPPPKADIDVKGSAWRLVREGGAPTFAAGKVHVFLRAQSRAHSRYLPGLSIGGERGPRLGFLGGYYAPSLLPADTGRAYKLVVRGQGERLTVRFEPGGPVMTVFAPGPKDTQVKIRAEGDVALTAPIDGTNVRGFYNRRPSFARKMKAGESPGLQAKLAQSLVVQPKQGASTLVDTDCARPRLLSPLKRGSTSVFLVQLGKGPQEAKAFDSLYRLKHTPTPHIELRTCKAVSTSTITLPVP